MVGMGSGGWKRVALGGNKKVCAKEKLLVCENGRFLKQARNGLCKRKFFIRKKAVFEDSKKWFKQAVFWLRKREAFESKA